MTSIGNLRHKWYGETAWVVGSGATLGHVSRGFFNGKRTIAVNHVARLYGFTPDVLFSHYHRDVQESLEPQSLGVTLRLDTNTLQPWLDAPSNVVFVDVPYESPPGPAWDPYLFPPEPNSLVYGSSSIHGAIHLAAHMGATFIVLVGVDCGWLDGQHRFPGYPDPASPPPDVMPIWERHLRLLKQWLRERYDVDVYSLNPFLNLNLEGHEFRGAG